MLSMNQLSLSGKCVLIRQDLNVPMRDGVISNNARLRAALPTIRSAVADGAGLRVKPSLVKLTSWYAMASVGGLVTGSEADFRPSHGITTPKSPTKLIRMIRLTMNPLDLTAIMVAIPLEVEPVPQK